MRFLSRVVIALFLIAAFFSCRKESRGITAFEKTNLEITDSIREGRYQAAMRLIQAGLANASDSDAWYNFIVHRGLLNYYASNPDSIKIDVGEALRYLNSKSYSPLRQHLLTKCYGMLGAMYVQYSFNQDSCVHYQRLALNSALKEADRSEAIQAMGNLADTYRLSGKLDLCCAMYIDAIRMADSLRVAQDEYIPLYGGLAGAYTSLNDFENSRKWLDKELLLWDVMTPYEKFNYLNNSGNDYYLGGDYLKSLVQFNKLDSLLQHHPDWIWEKRFCSANTTDVLIALDRVAGLDSVIDKNLYYFTVEQPNDYVKGHLYTQKMQLLASEGKYDSVEMILKTHPMDETMRPEQRLLRLKFMMRYFADSRQWERGFKAQQDLNLLDDSLRNERVAQLSHALRLGYERDHNMLEMKIEVNRRKQQLYIWIIIATVAILVIGMLIMLSVVRRQKHAAKESRMLMHIRELKMADSRQRITPHFIYNALNHVLALRAKGEEDDLNTVVTLLRQQQLIADDILVSLKSELEFVKAFVKVRSSSRRSSLRFEIDIDDGIDDVDNLAVPSMSIQIFVENAFKHGFSSLDLNSERILRIVVAKESDTHVRISVANNASPVQHPSTDSTRQGLRIVDATLQYLNDRYSEKARLQVGRCKMPPEGGGFIAEIFIPITYKL